MEMNAPGCYATLCFLVCLCLLGGEANCCPQRILSKEVRKVLKKSRGIKVIPRKPKKKYHVV